MAKKIDLARAQAAEERIAARLQEHPELAERTARFFAGDLSPAELEGLMSDERLEHPTVIKLPKSILDRADALKERVGRDPKVQMMGRVSRNAVLRLAMLRGLEVLEAEYAEERADVEARREALPKPKRTRRRGQGDTR